MAGLVPAIHVLLAKRKNVDARHKAGHDAWGKRVAHDKRHFFVLPGSFTASKVWNSTL